jgi:hypothetical protein
MANTFTALQPILFSVAHEVSAEPFGAVSAINTSFDSKGVAVGDLVKVPVAPVRAIADFTPAATPPAGVDATASEVSVQITASKKSSFNLTGEQIRSLDNGANSQEWIRQMVGQMMRSLRNAAEADCVTAIYTGASRATGTAGTNPFASALTPLADARKILLDNGAPMADLQFVGNSTSETNLLKLGVVLDASIAGSDEERRSGLLRRQYGFEMRTSAGIALHTKGAGVNYITNGVRAAGDTAVPIDGGTVNTTGIKAGDCVTFAADSTNVFVVNAGITATAGTITLGNPGLRGSVADGNAMTVGDNYTPNLAFERSAVVGILRPPVMPANPTISQTLISDGMGMTYLLLDIAQYGQRSWELHLAWGFKAVQSEHIAILRG